MGDTSGIGILDKTMLEWVRLALGSAPTSIADYDKSVELPVLVKPYIKPDCDYMVVLFSDTPLITKRTVAAAVEEAYNSGKTVLKMTRGYVFHCAYLQNIEKIYTENTFYFDEEDFITAFSYKQVGLITDILKNRILDYHMGQGVYFTDLAGTFIGCDVSIEPGVTVGCNNIVRGKTKIKKGVRLGNNNVLDDCVIDEGASLENTHAVRSFIGKNSEVGPFVRLKGNCVIGEGCKIGPFVELADCKIEANTEIKR